MPHPAEAGTPARAQTIQLPKPRLTGPLPLESSLRRRRSIREFGGEPLRLEQVSQLLWAAQGITDESGKRTAPSAGALYPLEIFLVAGKVAGLTAGVYRYSPSQHLLEAVSDGDKRAALSSAALGQEAVTQAPATIVIAAVFSRTTQKYGARGERYVHIEAGHAGQNIYLEATALGLGAVLIGAFDDPEVAASIGLSREEQPLAMFPVGAPRT